MIKQIRSIVPFLVAVFFWVACVQNVPARSVSSSGQPILYSERPIGDSSGETLGALATPLATSFSEMMGLPAAQLSTMYLFPWYNNVDLNTQVQLGNVGTSNTNVTVSVGGLALESYLLVPNQAAQINFPALNQGPVKVESSANVPSIASERVMYSPFGTFTSFSEMMGLPQGQLDTAYWLPWYNNVDLDTQLRFGNVSDSPANVRVFIAGQEMPNSPFVLAVGESKRVSFAGINNGPVKIESNVNIVAAERVIYKINGGPVSFSEMMGLPNNHLDTTYWLPWYNNVDLDTQLRFGNVSDSPANVRVFIAGQEMPNSPFVLAVGESKRVSFAGINNGPVKIESNVNIVAAERVIYKINGGPVSFSEMMGLPNNHLDTTYWLPWYNNVDLDTQLRFGNVSDTTSTVRVYIGDAEMTSGCLPSNSPFTLAPNASLRVRCIGVNNGPVKIVSVTGQSILASERVILPSATYYVSPTGSDSNPGHADPAMEDDPEGRQYGCRSQYGGCEGRELCRTRNGQPLRESGITDHL